MVSFNNALNNADKSDDLLAKRRRETHTKELAKARERSSTLRLVSPSAIQLNKKKARLSKTNKPQEDISDTESEVTMANEKVVRVKKSEYAEMKEALDETIPALELKIGQLEEENEKGGSAFRKLTDEHEKLQQENEVLIKEKQKLSQLLQDAYTALKDGGKHSKNEEKQCIKDEIKGWLKSTGFVKVKFAKDKKLKDFVGEVYEAIKDRAKLNVPGSDTEISKSEFWRIYEGPTAAALADRRSYTQTGCYKSCQEWHREEGTLPTVVEMKNVYNLPKEEEPEYAQKKKLLTWYCNDYLPKAAGFEHYGPTIRPYKLAAAMVNVKGVHKPQPVVSKESEAFGLFLFENCREKWMAIIPKKLENPRWKIPNYDKEKPATHPYNSTKWSDKNSGQVKGSGWSAEGFKAFNDYLHHIKALRKQDKTNKWVLQKFCRQLIRDEMGVTETKHTNKRNRGGKAKAESPKYCEIDELSDDYSVHSEMTHGEL